MKKLKIIILLILTALLLTACHSIPSSGRCAIIKLPDGMIIRGECTDYTYSYGTVTLTVNGVKYLTSVGDVVIYRDE